MKTQTENTKHKVTPKEAKEALIYFWNVGLYNTYGDQQHYLEILMRYSANKLNMLLIDTNKKPL